MGDATARQGNQAEHRGGGKEAQGCCQASCLESILFSQILIVAYRERFLYDVAKNVKFEIFQPCVLAIVTGCVLSPA